MKFFYGPKLVDYNIAITPIKIFLNYSNINLLGYKVNFFSIAIIEDKLKIISKIFYPIILNNLEYYLNLTGYLYSLVYFYI